MTPASYYTPFSNHILPRRDGQGSNEGPKLTAQPHLNGSVGGRTVAGTFRILETQEQERSVRRLDGQFELTTSVRDPSANYSSPSYYPLTSACYKVLGHHNSSPTNPASASSASRSSTNLHGAASARLPPSLTSWQTQTLHPPRGSVSQAPD